MRTAFRKILRDITSRKIRTALVSTSVFIGVLGVVALSTMGQLITRQSHENIKTEELAMLRIYLQPTTITPDHTDMMEKLYAVGGVQHIEGQAAYTLNWRKTGERDYRQGQIFGYSETLSEVQIEPPTLLEGEFPESGKRQIAIERRLALKHGLKVGDLVVMQVNSRGFPTQERWTVTGIVYQTYIYPGGTGAETSFYAASYEDARHIANFMGYSSIYARFDNYSRAQEEAVPFLTTLSENSPYKIFYHLLDNPTENTFIVGIEDFTRVLLVLALLAMIVSSFLVTNVVNIIMVEQRRQIGAMKAIGATRLDIYSIYLGIALSYGITGTIPGVIFGLPLGIYAAQQIAPLINLHLENTTPPIQSLFLGLFLGLIVPLLAAFLPIFRGANVSILEAMSDQGIAAQYGKGWSLAKIIKRLPLSLDTRLVFNNIIHRKSRLTLTIISLTLAAAAFMAIFAVFVSVNNQVANLRETLMAGTPNLQAAFETLVTNPDEEKIIAIQRGVAIEMQVEEERSDLVAEIIPPESIYVTGIDTDTDLIYVPLVEGNGWNADPERKGIVLTEGLANRLDKQIGDTLQLSVIDNIGAFEVIGIATFALETAFMEWQQLSDFVGVITDAPTPNAYWETVKVADEENIWAVGIDERVGATLSRDFDPSQPAVMISSELANAGNLEQGEMVMIEGDTQSLEYPILEVIQVTPDQLAMVAGNLPPDVRSQGTEVKVVAMLWSELGKLEGMEDRQFSPDTFLVNLENPTRITVESEGEPQRNSVAIPIHLIQGEFADNIVQTVLGVGLVMNLASLLMALVGAIGLMTITSIGVFERQREIGVMRSLGASNQKVIGIFLMEGLFVGWLSWLIGLPLSYILSHLLIDMVPFSRALHFNYTILAPLVGLFGMLLLTLFASIYPSMLAARKTISDILRYQ